MAIPAINPVVAAIAAQHVIEGGTFQPLDTDQCIATIALRVLGAVLQGQVHSDTGGSIRIAGRICAGTTV